MKLHGAITINGKRYEKGDEVSWLSIYPFFLFHMAIFGGSGFLLAYAGDDVPTQFLFLHGGIAILVYLVFYFVIFGWDEVRWMFINAALGIYGLWCEIGWLLGLFGAQISDYPWHRHVVPFLYYILYTFLLRQMVLDLFHAREDPERKSRIEWTYVFVSLLFYTCVYVYGRLH